MDDKIIRKSKVSILKSYGENFTEKEYITNPAIGREEEIKQLVLILLTPEKSAILTGKPGVGKTAIVEGLAYRIQLGNVPDALKGYQIIKVNTSALLGTDPDTGESKIQILLDELKEYTNLILFIDEIHTLMGSKGESLDFANMFKPGLDRGDIKVIGATTTEEYERYILRDKAFVRRFQKVEVLEPTREQTIAICMGTLPKIEKKTGAKLMYDPYVKQKIMAFLTDLTSEYRRIYEIGSRYPDVTLTILQQAFSYAIYNNRRYVSFKDLYDAIRFTKAVYPDVIKKELVVFADEFEVFCDSVDLKYLYLPKASTIPAFQWQQSLEYLENGTLKTELEFIYAPKATGFNYVYNNGHQMNDMQFLNELKFIYAPNLQTIDMTDGTFPLNTTTTLYLSDEFSFFNILKKPQLKIVAPQESYAHTVANENGYDFIASDSMTKTRGRSICSSVAGIRFGFYWNNIDEIEDLADNIEYGFIYSQKGVEDLSIETVDGVNVRQTEAVNRVDNGKSTSFNLVIANIPNGYLDREITARAYVCIDGMYFYSNIQRGSFSEVANLVLADDEIDQNTKNAVKNLLEV